MWSGSDKGPTCALGEWRGATGTLHLTQWGGTWPVQLLGSGLVFSLCVGGGEAGGLLAESPLFLLST